MALLAVLAGAITNLYFEIEESKKSDAKKLHIAEKYHQEKMAEFMKNKVCHHVEMQVIKF